LERILNDIAAQLEEREREKERTRLASIALDGGAVHSFHDDAVVAAASVSPRSRSRSGKAVMTHFLLAAFVAGPLDAGLALLFGMIVANVLVIANALGTAVNGIIDEASRAPLPLWRAIRDAPYGNGAGWADRPRADKCGTIHVASRGGQWQLKQKKKRNYGGGHGCANLTPNPPIRHVKESQKRKRP
jgi:hypothetical protein